MIDSPMAPGLLRSLSTLLTCAALTSLGTAQTICLTAELEGAQEVPANGSNAKGTACFQLDPVANTLTYEIVYDGLTAAETMAHIHGYAPAGANGGVLTPLPGGLHKAGVWFYPPGDEDKILAGQTYVNIHSGAFPGGEIRGQIVRDVNNASMVSSMDGPQSGTPSAARGLACFSVDTLVNRIDYQMTFTASTMMGAETLAHIHGFAAPGSNAGVLHNLALGFHKKGTWFYAESQEAQILSDLSYTNIHSGMFPGGEIRGQDVVVCKCEPNFASYCTAGTSANGCQATLSGSGFPSATLPSGFTLSAAGVEGQKDGLFFFGVNGRQANVWGNGTSFQCVVPPVKRAGLLTGSGTSGLCDGTFSQDLNTRWQAKPSQNPGAGAVVQAQLWYRDPANTSNQTTSLSDAFEFSVCP